MYIRTTVLLRTLVFGLVNVFTKLRMIFNLWIKMHLVTKLLQHFQRIHPLASISYANWNLKKRDHKSYYHLSPAAWSTIKPVTSAKSASVNFPLPLGALKNTNF